MKILQVPKKNDGNDGKVEKESKMMGTSVIYLFIYFLLAATNARKDRIF